MTQTKGSRVKVGGVSMVTSCQCRFKVLCMDVPSSSSSIDTSKQCRGIMANRTCSSQTHRVRNYTLPFSLSPFYLQCAFLLVLVCIITVNLPSSEAASVPQRPSKTIQQSAVQFLSRYGYISGRSQELDDLRAPEDFDLAIKQFQRFAGISETGTVDSKMLELMAKPRCGNKDFVGRSDMFSRRKKRYNLAPSKWVNKQRLTFRILNYSPDLSKSKTRIAIYNALYVWEKKTTLEFVEKISGHADIMIMFARQDHGDGYVFDGKGKVLAHAFFPGENRGGDMHFDDDEHWTVNSQEGIDLFMVAAHEFGHALGLAHSNVQGALMYPWYQGYQENFELPHDDVLGIKRLYGGRRAKPDDNFTPSLPKIPTRSPDEGSNTPPTGTPPSIDPEGSIPNPCTMAYDAVAVIRQEVYIFRQRWFWRLNAEGIIRGSPVQIHQFWRDLPATVDHVDALYEHPKTGKIIFFIGDRYWKFDANHLISGFPKEGRPLTEFGIPLDVKKIDAVFVWSTKKKTYLISGNRYWKLAENDIAEYDYPRNMSIWEGVHLPVNAAFKYWDEKTYFFQDQYYWEFNDDNMAVNHEEPKKSSIKFMRCENSEVNPESNRISQSTGSGHSVNYLTLPGYVLLLLTSILVRILH